jgi:hypothetical protein
MLRAARMKPRVGLGNWLPWLRKNFDWSDDTAAGYIDVYELSRNPKFRSLRNLPLEALYLLARKTVPEEARDAIVARAEEGKKITAADVRTEIIKKRGHREAGVGVDEDSRAFVAV